MKFERQRMVDWYNVRQLVATGIKTIISSIFGNFADKREIQSVLSKEDFHDHSATKEMWVDFVADLGDGFNSTYTIATLLAQEKLAVSMVNGQEIQLPRADILIMGGDQVYPTPEKKEYDNRLQGPYEAAFPKTSDPTRPKLYALPGNHDWYDGLANFLKLFCQQRTLGNWQTCQKRSYFALKLPHNYWIWGIDVQLNADIDLPQQEYFKEVVRKDQAHSTAIRLQKIILCTAEPAWVYNSLKKIDHSYSRLSFFLRECVPAQNYEVAAIITGDLHHYSRYLCVSNFHFEKQVNPSIDSNIRPIQLITAGGGGAFLHPTHVLEKEIRLKDETKYELHSCFPEKSTSKKLAFLNLLFPIRNPGLSTSLGLYHLFTAWFLQSSGIHAPGSFLEKVKSIEFSSSGFQEYCRVVVESTRHSPSVVILNLILFIGILKFTDISSGRGKWNYLAGVPHAALQVATFYCLLWLFARINLDQLEMGVNELRQILLFTVEMLVAGSFVSGMIFGVYLLVSSLIFKSHVTESFSSLRLQGYKNFLRMRIDATGLTIFPIGVRRIITNWKNKGTEENPAFTGKSPHYELIEKGPIHIK